MGDRFLSEVVAMHKLRADVRKLKPDKREIFMARMAHAAEDWAARRTDPDLRHELLEIARLMRRIDQSAMALVGLPPARELSRR